jgi:GTP-binding protein
MAISAQSKQGVQELLRAVKRIVENARAEQAVEEAEAAPDIPTITLQGDDDAWQVTRTDDGFVVSGPKIERFASRTHFDSDEGVQRLRDIMKKTGILHELVRQGIKSGNSIIIGKYGRFDY